MEFEKDPLSEVNEKPFDNYHIKCGEIFTTNLTNDFLIVCNACNNEKFNNLKKFSEHFSQCYSGSTIFIKNENLADENEDEMDETAETIFPDIQSTVKTETSECTNLNKDTRIPNKVNSDAKPHKCDQCKKSFLYLTALVNHSKIHKSKRYDCTVCGLIFREKSEMEKHMESHDNLEKSYKCSYCGKLFKYLSLYEHHKQLHSGPGKFNCLKCERTFTVAFHLVEHNRRRHPVYRKTLDS